MPYNPNLPQENTLIDAAQMRAQLQALDAEIQARATSTDLANAVAGTSSNSNGVATLSQAASGGYDPSQMQAVLDKIDELINALRR